MKKILNKFQLTAIDIAKHHTENALDKLNTIQNNKTITALSIGEIVMQLNSAIDILKD